MYALKRDQELQALDTRIVIIKREMERLGIEIATSRAEAYKKAVRDRYTLKRKLQKLELERELNLANRDKELG